MNTNGKRVGCHTKLLYEVMYSVATSEHKLVTDNCDIYLVECKSYSTKCLRLYLLSLSSKLSSHQAGLHSIIKSNLLSLASQLGTPCNRRLFILVFFSKKSVILIRNLKLCISRRLETSSV